MFPHYKIGPEARKYFEIAYENQMSGHFDRAIHYYKKSLRIEPTAEGYTFLGWTYSLVGKFRMAIMQCKKAISYDPDFGNPYNDIGSYLMQMGLLNEAIPWLQKAKKVTRYSNPEFPYCNLGRLYERKGLWPLAYIEYQRAAALNSDHAPAVESLQRLAARLN